MLRKTIIITALLISPALADEAADIADFNQAYAEYSNLVKTSEDIDAAIVAAEKAYKLAPRIYGKKSEEYAVVTYNLAELYDVKGKNGQIEFKGDVKLRNELKASNLYAKYFRMKNLSDAPKELDYLNKYIPYIVAYHNSHPAVAKLEISEYFLEIARNLILSDTELANLELYIAIIRAENISIVYAIENFENAIRLFENDEKENSPQLAESQFWLARHDIGNKKYDIADMRLTKVVNYLERAPSDTQQLRNEALQLLSLMKIKKDDIEAADFYYKQIVTPDDHQGYLVPINKPEAYPPLTNVFLNRIPAVVKVEYDVDMFGKTFNIDIPYLVKIEKNWIAPVSFEEYVNYVTELVATITYLPPHKNGEKVFIREVHETLIFRPHMVY